LHQKQGLYENNQPYILSLLKPLPLPITDLVGEGCVPFGIPDDGQSSQTKQY
jgi:hypothetical protein